MILRCLQSSQTASIQVSLSWAQLGNNFKLKFLGKYYLLIVRSFLKNRDQIVVQYNFSLQETAAQYLLAWVLVVNQLHMGHW